MSSQTELSTNIQSEIEKIKGLALVQQGESKKDADARVLLYFYTYLLPNNPNLAAAVGLDNVGLIYTPNITSGFESKIYNELLKAMPKAIHPTVIAYNEDFAKAYLENSNAKSAAISQIQETILTNAQALFNHYSPSEEWTKDKIKHVVSVITDGGRILSIGDQGGYYGALISLGKHACNCVGTQNAIPTQFRLALGIDLGTIESKLNEEGYEGLHILRENIPMELRDAFVHLVLESLDGLQTRLIQFEDFNGEKARQYADWAKQNLNTPSFNDDMHGASAVGKAAIEGVREFKKVNLNTSLYIFVGAGAMNSSMYERLIENNSEISKRCVFFDEHGVLAVGRSRKDGKEGDGIMKFQKDLKMVIGQDSNDFRINELLKLVGNDSSKFFEITLEQILDCFKDQIGHDGAIFLLGGSACCGHFTDELISKAHNIVDKKNPDALTTVCVVPLSNPAKCSEIVTDLKRLDDIGVKQYFMERVHTIMELTHKKVTIITGTKLETMEGEIANQANNLLVFPALTLACYLGDFKGIDSGMWEVIISSLIDFHRQFNEIPGSIIPSAKQIVRVTEYIVEKVLEYAINTNQTKSEIFKKLKDSKKLHTKLKEIFEFTRGINIPKQGSDEYTELMTLCGGSTE